MIPDDRGRGSQTVSWSNGRAAPGRARSLGERAGRILGGAERMLVAERERWILWVPVFFGAGVALYFSLPSEPALWPWLVAAFLCLVAAFVLRRRPAAGEQPGAMILAAGVVALALVFAGAAVATWRAQSVAAPILVSSIGPERISGRVVRAQDLPDGSRVVLDRLHIPRIEPEATPARVRIRLRTGGAPLLAGERIAVTAILGPPPPPSAPGGFDFQREAYFAGLGGVGFALGPAKIAGADDGATAPDQAASAQPGASRFVLWMARLRQAIAARIRAALPGEEGPVAVALMTGDQGSIAPDVIAAMRNAGLAHLLAVSGLHFVLVAGTVFFAVRALLALIPPLALRYPIKKWAAGVALAATFGYLMITGQSAPTERAFIMASLLFLAVLIDRTAISMRTVAWAAMAILLVQPESLLRASFQLSFSAVVALIAAFEAWRSFRAWIARRQAHETDLPAAEQDDARGIDEGLGAAAPQPSGPGRTRGAKRRWIGTGAIYGAEIVTATLISSVATAPLLIYHFGRFADYGVAANLVAIPLAGLWIMPWAVAAYALMPFGLEQLAMTPMGWGIHVVIATARAVAAWPGAVIDVPAVPLGAVAAIALGGLWLCIWRTRWRLAGLLVIAGGIAAMIATRPPDILVDADAKLIGVRDAAGELLLSSLRTAKFDAQTWQRRLGDNESEKFPANGPTADKRLSCDSAGCIYRAHGRIAALAKTEDALAEDCHSGDVVVSLIPARRICAGPPVIDRFDLWRNGAHAIWMGGSGIQIESVKAWQGMRPWVPQPEWKRERRSATRRSGAGAGESR